MPGSENYENEIADGSNARTIKCKYCNSVVLTPKTAEFVTTEFQLPLFEQRKPTLENPDRELVSQFWKVNDMFTFQNVGFTNTVGNTKFLACADCDAGPIGYFDIESKLSYIALCRVQHV